MRTCVLGGVCLPNKERKETKKDLEPYLNPEFQSANINQIFSCILMDRSRHNAKFITPKPPITTPPENSTENTNNTYLVELSCQFFGYHKNKKNNKHAGEALILQDCIALHIFRETIRTKTLIRLCSGPERGSEFVHCLREVTVSKPAPSKLPCIYGGHAFTELFWNGPAKVELIYGA